MEGFGGEMDEDEILLIMFGKTKDCGSGLLTWDHLFSNDFFVTKVPKHIHKQPTCASTSSTTLNRESTCTCDNTSTSQCNRNKCSCSLDYLYEKNHVDYSTSKIPKPRIVKLDSGIGMDSDPGHSDYSDGESDFDIDCACESQSNVENLPGVANSYSRSPHKHLGRSTSKQGKKSRQEEVNLVQIVNSYKAAVQLYHGSLFNVRGGFF